MGGRWRVEYEEALIRWIETRRPSLPQIVAVVRWAAARKSLGKPEGAVRSPDPEWPEDELETVPLANVDVFYLAYPSRTEDPVMFVRAFTSV